MFRTKELMDAAEQKFLLSERAENLSKSPADGFFVTSSKPDEVLVVVETSGPNQEDPLIFSKESLNKGIFDIGKD